MSATGNTRARELCVRGVTHDDALTLAARDNKVGTSIERRSVGYKYSGSIFTVRLTGIRYPKFGAAHIEGRTIRHNRAIKICARWVLYRYIKTCGRRIKIDRVYDAASAYVKTPLHV